MLSLCRNAFVLKGFALALASTALICCNPSPKAGGGIGGTGVVSVPSVSSGTVTELGSVSVSGTDYDDSKALYCIDDQPCTTQNSLKVGMVVQVNGTAQSLSDGSIMRVADIVTFQHTAAGVVQSVAADGSSVILLGQVVAVNPKTVIHESIPGGAVSNLRAGVDVIQVSGLVAGDGHIVATFIMKPTAITHYEVEGIIKNNDAGTKRFEIGQLVVDYSSADVSAITTDGTTNWNNYVVHVRGELREPWTEVPYGGTLLATKIKPVGFTVEDSAEAKLEGFITNVTQLGTVTINNHPIDVSSATAFEGGTASELVVGTHVFIHGTLVRGVLGAQQVIFKENLQMESNVESIDLQSRTLTLAGLPGLSIETDARTEIKNGGAVSRFEEIRVGDHLKIHAKLSHADRVAATELEKTGSSPTIMLEAPLQSADDPQILLAAVSIDTSQIPEIEFSGNYGPIGRKTFFEKALLGQPAWSKGILTGSIVTWNSVGIRR